VWTAECERALADAEASKQELRLLRKKWISYLNKLTAVTRSKLGAIERNKVSGWGRGCGTGSHGSSTSCLVDSHRACMLLRARAGRGAHHHRGARARRHRQAVQGRLQQRKRL
jgi:hypothetical protein